MKKYQPKGIERQLEKFNQQYQELVENFAVEVFEARIVPYCQRKNLSFCMMNGWPKLYDVKGDQVPLPKFIENLYLIQDLTGSISYNFPDYNPHKQNFSENDIKAFNKRPTGRLCEYIFSPALC